MGKEKGIYFKTDPCRESKLKTRTALAYAEENGLSKILEVARKMADVCNNCPYRCV